METTKLTDAQIQVVLKEECRTIRMRSLLRYGILFAVLFAFFFWVFYFNPFKFDDFDAMVFKRALFAAFPSWLFRGFELVALLLFAAAVRKHAIKQERKHFEKHAPIEYRKAYLEKDVEIAKLKNQYYYTEENNRRLEKENKELKLRIGTVTDAVGIRKV